jgi:hypothetical protein
LPLLNVALRLLRLALPLLSLTLPSLSLTLRLLSFLHHFVDANKMVGYIVARCLAGCLGFVYNQHKIAPFRVTQQMLQIPGKPELDAVLGAIDARLKISCKVFDDFLLHLLSLSFLSWWLPLLHVTLPLVHVAPRLLSPTLPFLTVTSRLI